VDGARLGVQMVQKLVRTRPNARRIVPSVEEHDRPHYEEMLRLLGQVDGWLARIDPATDHPRPDARSPLGADDQRTHPFQTSHAAWHALSHAVDPLHCLRSVLRDAHTIHMYAPYALVRAALENASAAVWLLHPSSRTERITRRLRLCALDVRSGERALRRIGGSRLRPENERLDELRAIAAHAGADAGAAVRRVTYGEVVEEAGAALASGSPATAFVWSLCSGITHGDFWTTINAAQHVELPGAPAGMVSMKITADVEKLKFATTVAVHMTMLGWRLYDERSRAPF
jgi:hypothetical protein